MLLHGSVLFDCSIVLWRGSGRTRLTIEIPGVSSLSQAEGLQLQSVTARGEMGGPATGQSDRECGAARSKANTKGP